MAFHPRRLRADTPRLLALPAAVSVGFLIGFLVIFYLMIWRPQAKRAKEHRTCSPACRKGDEVVTGGVIAGKVSKVADDFVVIEVSDSVELKFQKRPSPPLCPRAR